MKKNLISLLMLLLFSFSGLAWAQHQTAPSITAEQALTMLKQGNARFAGGESTHPRQDKARIKEVDEKGQHPYAAILSCSDSRVPPECIFDAGIGDIFVIRVAGNICGTSETGSLEYAAEHTKVPLIVVLGHTSCGAVTATLENAEAPGSIADLVSKIKPAVAAAREKHPALKGKELNRACCTENVRQVMEDLFRKSPIIHELAGEGKVRVIGALYDLATGRVTFMEPCKEHRH